LIKELNLLNTSLKAKNKFTSQMYSDVKASGMKLTLFIKHINERKHDQEHDQDQEQEHFPNCKKPV